MFEGADIPEFTYIGEPTLVLMGGQQFWGEEILGGADFCPGCPIHFPREIRSPEIVGWNPCRSFLRPAWMVPIRVSREVSSVPGLETRLVKPVEFQAGRSGR